MLAKAFGVSPAQVRACTLNEITAMWKVLEMIKEMEARSGR